MSFVELDFPPGIRRAGTEYQSKGGWYDANLVRWRSGFMGPMKGWAQRTTSAMTGKCRTLLPWRDNSGVRWIGAGTHSKLYVATQSQVAPSDITPSGFVAGTADASAAGGYGSLDYGEGTYGTPRTDTSSIQEAGVWTLDTFGQNLVACQSDDGLIYQWAPPNTAVVAAALGGTAPTGNRGIVVTPERFLFALGAGGNKRKVQWADQESTSSWTPSATNQAGDYELATQGHLLCGRRLRNATLLFTDVDAHAAVYIGLPYVYSIQRIGENCGPISKGAPIVVDVRAFWMTKNGFAMSDGATVSPLQCDIYDAVFSDLNQTQASKITGHSLAGENEVWWFYPAAASTECDRYVAYNYLEGHWNMGPMARLAGCDRGVFNNPIRADSDGYLWDHETGFVYTGGLTPYAETGPMELGKGDRISKVRELIPDEKTEGDVVVRFYAKDAPDGDATTYGPYSMSDFVDVRFAARQAKMRVTGNVATSWRWGTARLDVVPGGRR